ncbi:hypothetical protein [Paenibacillus cisolokensis]|nr:hypothetical protein [Paenibacillus cisolokensis]
MVQCSIIALSAAAIVLLAVNPRNGTNRWAAFFLFSAGIGGLPYTIRDSFTAGAIHYVRKAIIGSGPRRFAAPIIMPTDGGAAEGGRPG